MTIARSSSRTKNHVPFNRKMPLWASTISLPFAASSLADRDGTAPPSGRAAKAKSGSNSPGLVARVGHASANVSSLLISRVRVKPVQSLLQLIHLLKAIPFPQKC
ncbi:hypothetical protein PVK06_045461 [Gossypium arboreum]|uniref:Uncharacterized protein n=1 Tax=Gossypium arboreum TaxID=29729 RepID=A0ABR0MU45_GOSAR|nr:hypothetical protein PVK06_045461 [Gossypium arboreum]